jgi:hypothetical protein
MQCSRAHFYILPAKITKQCATCILLPFTNNSQIQWCNLLSCTNILVLQTFFFKSSKSKWCCVFTFICILLRLILFHLYCIVVLQHLVLNGKVVHFEQVKYRHVCIIYLEEAETKKFALQNGAN